VDLDPTVHVGGGVAEEEKKLSAILEHFNERFGTEFTPADKIMDEMEEHMTNNKEVKMLENITPIIILDTILQLN